MRIYTLLANPMYDTFLGNLLWSHLWLVAPSGLVAPSDVNDA
jgi:hypothetical protein